MTTATHSTTLTDTPVLVCTSAGPAGNAQVVLADGSYETTAERVFWRASPGQEVLRVPLETRVVIRPVRRFPGPRPAAEGEQRLLAALAPHRVVPAQPAAPAEEMTDARLGDALAAGEVGTAESLALGLWRRQGLAATHAAVAASLAQAPARRAQGTGSVLKERIAAATAGAVLERLRARTPEAPSAARDGARPVVLAVPPGDPHTLALTALAHQLQEAGETVLVVDDAPVGELAALVAQRTPRAVVVSAHLPWPLAGARALLGALRSACPDTLLAVGGPGAPTALPRADLLTSEPLALLHALRTRCGALSQREREVLLAVAEGRTTNEIAHDLGLSPATVKTHLDRVFAKTGTEHRAAAVARALRQGWIS